MSVKLVLLGMLKDGPLHGYELKSRIEREMGDWTSIAFGSIYFALKKLSEDGFVKQTGEEQHGNRPSRIIYKITGSGREEFLRLLQRIWSENERTFSGIDIGLYFLNELEAGQAVGMIKKRIAYTLKAIEHLTAHRDAELKSPDVPAVAAAIFSHSLHHLEAELSWLRETEDKIREGEY